MRLSILLAGLLAAIPISHVVSAEDSAIPDQRAALWTAVEKGDYKKAKNALDVLAVLLTAEEQWADAVGDFEKLLKEATDKPFRHALKVQLARAVMARTGSPGALRSCDDMELASMSRKMAAAAVGDPLLRPQMLALLLQQDPRLDNLDAVLLPQELPIDALDVRGLQTAIEPLVTSRESLQPLQNRDPVALMIEILNAIGKERAEQGHQLDSEFSQLYVSLLASPCSKQQVTVIVQKLFDTKRRDRARVKHDEIARQLLKQCHPSNTEWVVLTVAQHAYRSGNRTAVPTLIDTIDLSQADEEVRRVLLLLKAESLLGDRNHKEARNELLKWLELFPNSDQADRVFFLLGWSYLAEGENQRAKGCFEDLIRRYPDSQYSVRAKSFLKRL